MQNHLKFAIAFLSVALFAVVVGSLTSPGSVNSAAPVVSQQVQSAGGRFHHDAIPTATAAPAPAALAPAETNTATPAKQPVAIALSTASDLYTLINDKPASITKVVFHNGTNQVTVEVAGHSSIILLPDDGSKRELVNTLVAAKIPFTATEPNPFSTFIGHWWPALLIALVLFVIINITRQLQMRQALSGDNGGSPLGKIKGMGESRAKSASKEKDRIEKVTFDDVAGCDEAVKELRRVVKGLIRPQIYQIFHAKRARGILLVGPPGTGKTLLARAVAGECAGTFSFLSGSDFVEMLVGVGAARVRNLFDEARQTVAKTKKPHVIFIDEIDAVGGKRGGPAMGRNDERESTLNQLLVELDGIVGNKGIILIAATNRPDMLDDALLRPGRFDAQVQVDLPDKAGREKIFAIHLRKRMDFLSGVTLSALAQRSYTFSGAEIMGACERAATLAAERYEEELLKVEAQGVSFEEALKQVHPTMTMSDFDEGLDFVRFGDAKPSKQKNMLEVQKKNTAVHEGGHACTAVVFPNFDPVIKITIMRRSKALGYVQYMPENDAVSFTREQAIAKMVTCMAGRAAQELFLKTCDTGASNDFQQATNVARMMVSSWGMTKLGPISVGNSDSPFAGMSGGSSGSVGQDLANRMDKEWTDMVKTCYEAAKKIVEIDRERIEALVARLMENDTVLADEWKELCKKYPSKVKLEELKLPYWEGVIHE